MSPPLPTALRGRDIVCVGFAEWDSALWTNQQHLMSRLAAGNRVLFVESLGLRRPQVASRDIRRILRRLRTGLRGPRSLDGVSVLSPLVIPLHHSPLARRANARLLPRLVDRAASGMGMERPVLWSYVPQAEVLLAELDPSLVVYHCVDDIAAQKGVDAGSFRAAEARFATRADLVIASAPNLVARMRTLSDNVLEAPNVADTSLFATALDDGPVDARLAGLPEPRLVFTGAITATKLDLRLLAGVARMRPDWTIALLGPVGAGDPTTDLSVLDGHDNIHLLGAVRHDQLPDVLRGARVGLIPYLLNELTASIFPMKVYEYLSAGLPVVSTPLPALAGVAEIGFAADAAETVEAVEAAIAADDAESRASRSREAAEHSWEARLEEIAARIEEIER